jgi:hypothetical protein
MHMHGGVRNKRELAIREEGEKLIVVKDFVSLLGLIVGWMERISGGCGWRRRSEQSVVVVECLEEVWLVEGAVSLQHFPVTQQHKLLSYLFSSKTSTLYYYT